MYISDRKKFESTAKFWTETWAKPIDKEKSIQRIIDMGFHRESALKALENHDFDEGAALNELLGIWLWHIIFELTTGIFFFLINTKMARRQCE